MDGSNAGAAARGYNWMDLRPARELPFGSKCYVRCRRLGNQQCVAAIGVG